jgi:hypothetical protein
MSQKLSLEERWTELKNQKTKVTKENWAAYTRFLHTEGEQMPDGQGRNNSMRHYFLSPEQWADHPHSEIQGQQARKPLPSAGSLPEFPVFEINPGASQPARTLAYQENSMMERQATRQTEAWHTTKALEKEYKSCLNSVNLLDPEIAEYIRGPEHLYATAQIHEMYARAYEKLGRLDDEAFKQVIKIYQRGWQTTISGFYLAEAHASVTLEDNDMQYTDAQKFMAFPSVFKNRPEVMRYLRLFEDANPDDAQRTWARLKTYMMAQDKNITRGMTRADLYPRAQAASEEGHPVSDQEEEHQDIREQPSQAMSAPGKPAHVFTQAEIEAITVNAVKAAMSQYAKSASSAPPQYSDAASRMVYCWLHGWCRHTKCRHIKEGKPCTLKYNDSRTRVRKHGSTTDTYDPTRVFGHSRCNHQPRCISVEDAESATGPDSSPDMPGNTHSH